jgi:hypothetical protein
VACLRTGRALRVPRARAKGGGKKWLSDRFRGSCGDGSAGEGWAVAASVEEA